MSMYKQPTLLDQLIELTVPKRNACWSNAFWAMIHYVGNRLGDAEPYYVEGWLLVSDGKVAIEHAWLEIDGEIVDVTLPGKYEAGCYCPAYKFDAEAITDRVLNDVFLPLFAYDAKCIAKMERIFKSFPKDCAKIQLAATFMAQYQSQKEIAK